MEQCSRAYLDLLQAPQGHHSGSSVDELSPGFSISNLRDYQSTLVKRKVKPLVLKAVGASKFRIGIVLMGSVTPKKKKVKLMQLVEFLNNVVNSLLFEAKSQGQRLARQIVGNYPNFGLF